MKQFNELTKKELSQLSDMQFDAYVDIELANRGITKTVTSEPDYPDFAKVQDILPERDMTVYEVDGYTFQDLESAQKVTELISTLPQLKTDYNYTVGSEFKYVTGSQYQKPTVTISKIYSEPKYTAIKPLLKEIKNRKEAKQEVEEADSESAINYAAIDDIKQEMRKVVRKAIAFFAEAESISNDYNKYLAISNDRDTALRTLWTVYNVQDEELKTQVLEKLQQQEGSTK